MSARRYGLRFYALIGGFGCISMAAFVQGVLPMLEPQSRTDQVTKVVRTGLGELKWMEHKASDYTPLERVAARSTRARAAGTATRSTSAR
jgi:cytochrome c oxidase cbb3-type subunit I/II